MALDFNLLRPAGGSNPVNAFLQGQQDAFKRDAAQQEMAQANEMNALRRQQLTGQIQTQEETRTKNKAAEKTAMFRDRLLRAPNAAAARELVKMQYSDPDLAPILSQSGTVEQAIAEVPEDPTEFERFRQQQAMGMAEWMKSQMPKVAGNAVFLPGENRFITAPREPAPVAPSAPVAVMGPDGRPQFVTREQAIGMTPFSPAAVKFVGGGAGGGTRAAPAAPAPESNLTRKDIQKREANLPQARQSVSTVTNTMSVIENTIDKLLANRAGLNGVTGLIGGRTPGITDAARAAQADLDQLKNLAFIQGITELRNASKTGAAVGSVSNKEGDRFENLKASLDRTQSLQDMINSLNSLKTQAGVTKSIVKDAFDETYSYRDQNAQPAAGGGGGLSPAEQAELDQLRKQFRK